MPRFSMFLEGRKDLLGLLLLSAGAREEHMDNPLEERNIKVSTEVKDCLAGQKCADAEQSQIVSTASKSTDKTHTPPCGRQGR